MTRIICITGLGEDEFIFDKIVDHLPGNKLVMSLWKLLPDQRVADLNVAAFAREMIMRYDITANDLIIGHSTGGWLALHTKHAIGCRIIQLASWTNIRKINVPVSNRHIIYFAAQSGLYLNSLVMLLSIGTHYRNSPSRVVFERVFKRLITGNRANVINQLRLIFNPVPENVTIVPDLRIHARGDRLIGFPNGAVREVPGDHFSLYTYPEAVVAAIQQFIKDTYVTL